MLSQPRHAALNFTSCLSLPSRLQICNLSTLQMDASCGDWEAAAQHCRAALATNADFLQARNLCAAVLRRAGKAAEAEELVAGSRAMDPLDWWSAHLAGAGGSSSSGSSSVAEDGSADAGGGSSSGNEGGGGSAAKGLGCDTQTALDLALDYAEAGGCAAAALCTLRCACCDCSAGSCAVHAALWLCREVLHH